MFHRNDENGLTREIQDYLDRETQRNIDRGMNPEDARRAARRKLGPSARVLEDTRAAAHGRLFTWFEMLLRDIRHGLRMFAANPSFTLTAILSLAFGTGANVAMFSAADALLLRPLPVPHPREIVNLGVEFSTPDFTLLRASYPDYVDFRDQNRSFKGLLASTSITAGFAAEPGASAQVMPAMAVSGNFFDVLQIRPALGRGFRPEEDQVRGRDPVVVLSDTLWRDLGADPKILGRAVRIAGIGFTVIGVAPESFTIADCAFYIPLAMWPTITGQPNLLDSRAALSLTVKGRLKPGVSLASAQAEIETIAQNLRRAHPETNRSTRFTLKTELEMAIVSNHVYTALSGILGILAIAVFIVACANVAGLLTSRAPLRAREIALRLAIGARRGRLIRQLLTESSLIALAGALLGLPLAYAGIQWMRRIHYPTDLVTVPRIELDQRALAFSILIAMSSVILFGLIPAIQTTRTNLAAAFKSGAGVETGKRRLWGRNLLVAIQVAFSLLLLTLATFAYRAFTGELTGAAPFRTTHLAMLSLDPKLLRYSDADTLRLYQTLTQRASSIPRLQSLALGSAVPIGRVIPAVVNPEGFALPRNQPYATVYTSAVDEHYFDTLAIPILRGRGFATTDASGAPAVAIVNETFASRYWPAQDPIGKRILVNGVEWVTVVGVARNSRYLFVTEPPMGFLYLPYRQLPAAAMTVFAATSGDSTALLAPLRKLVQQIDPNMPIYDAQTMEHYYDARAVSVAHVITQIIGAMGLMGLAMAMVGLYALMSYSVSRLTREIGIRMAVGADRSNVMQMIARQGMLPVLIGIAAGLALSAATGRSLHAAFPLRYTYGPETYLLIIPLLLSIALLAAFLPARRASLVDPMTALREE